VVYIEAYGAYCYQIVLMTINLMDIHFSANWFLSHGTYGICNYGL